MGEAWSVRRRVLVFACGVVWFVEYICGVGMGCIDGCTHTARVFLFHMTMDTHSIVHPMSYVRCAMSYVVIIERSINEFHN